MHRSIFENDNTLGQAADIRLFTFWWDGIGYGGPDWFGNLRDAHACFNGAFAQSFRKLLYTTPFTSYNAGGIGIGSRLTGTGETTFNDAMLRAWILTAADSCGIGGDPGRLTISSRTISQIQSGDRLELPESSVNPLVTSDGAKKATDWVFIAAIAAFVLLIRR
jgi:hypothetical protein